MKYETIVVREDKSTIAVVKADTIDNVLDYQFLESLQRAVTNWVKNSYNGNEEYESSSKDFNVGDLCSVLDDVDLIKSLLTEGISNLTISVFSCDEGNPVWTYDTHLVNEDELEEPEE